MNYDVFKHFNETITTFKLFIFSLKMIILGLVFKVLILNLKLNYTLFFKN